MLELFRFPVVILVPPEPVELLFEEDPGRDIVMFRNGLMNFQKMPSTSTV